MLSSEEWALKLWRWLDERVSIIWTRFTRQAELNVSQPSHGVVAVWGRSKQTPSGGQESTNLRVSAVPRWSCVQCPPGACQGGPPRLMKHDGQKSAARGTNCLRECNEMYIKRRSSLGMTSICLDGPRSLRWDRPNFCLRRVVILNLALYNQKIGTRRPFLTRLRLSLFRES